MGHNHSRRYGFLLPLNKRSKLFLASLLGFTLFVGQEVLLGNERSNIKETPALKRAVVWAIQKYYFKKVNTKEFEKSSLFEILQILDKDSSLIQSGPKEADFVRGFKNKKSIKDSRLIPEKIGYIQIAYFSKSTVKEFRKIYEKLTTDGANRLILDLRGNEGGNFDSCLELSECFVSSGKTVGIIEGREKKAEKKSQNKKPIKIPMIVLVDSATASSSEFLASSLKTHNQAKIVGLPTQGKRTIQKMIPIETMWLSLTVGTWKIIENSDEPERIEPDFLIHGEERQLEKAISLFAFDKKLILEEECKH